MEIIKIFNRKGYEMEYWFVEHCNKFIQKYLLTCLLISNLNNEYFFNFIKFKEQVVVPFYSLVLYTILL